MKQALMKGALVERLKMPARGELIAVHDNYRLWLVVLDVTAAEPAIKATAIASDGTVSGSVGSALQVLRRQCPDVPKKVRLFSASVVMALLDLPVNPAKPRKQHEMDHLIQWELEPLVGDMNEQFTIGSILEGRCLISASQRQDIARTLEQRRQEGHGLARFGEIAQELSIVSRDDVQSSLALQEFLRVSEPNLACGWQVQALPGNQPVGDQPLQWWCTGIDRSIRQHWFDAFQEHGLVLTGIEPLAGSMVPALASQRSEEPAVVAEVLQEQLLISRMESGVITELQYLPRIAGTALNTQCVSVMLEMLSPHINTVIAGGWTNECDSSGADNATESRSDIIPEWLDKLGQEIERSPMLITEKLSYFQAQDDLQNLVAGLALSLHPKAQRQVMLPVIAPRDPGPPLWKNLDIYRYGLPLLIVLGVIAHGVYSLDRAAKLDEKMVGLEAEFQRQLQYNQQVAALNNETQQTTTSFLSVRSKLDALRTERSRIENGVLLRARQTPALLRAVASSVNEFVLLDGIAEPTSNSQGTFNLTAWATTELGASRFIETLTQQVERLDYQIASRQINAGINRLGGRGHTIDLWLVPAEILKKHEKTALKQKQGTAAR